MIAKELVLEKDKYVWLDKELELEYLTEKTYKLLFFWSASCLECPVVARGINAFMEKNNKEFCLVTIHVPLQDDDLREENISRKLALYNLSYPVILDHKAELIQQLGIQFVPTIILFNEEYKRVSFHIGGENIEHYIKGLVEL